QQNPHAQGEQDDGDAVIGDEVVDLGQGGPDEVQDLLDPHHGDHVRPPSAFPVVGVRDCACMSISYRWDLTRAPARRAGGYSTPPDVSGEHRRMRHTVRAVPRTAPSSRTACSAYAEQLA